MRWTIVIVCAIVLVLAVGGYLILSGKPNSTISGSNLTNTPSPGNSASSSTAASDCGVVSEETMKAINTNPNSPENEMISCMSDNINGCKISQLKFGCTTSSCSEDSIAITGNSGTACKVKYTEIKTGNSITCDFPKSYLQQVYAKLGASNKAWTTSMSLSLLLGFQLSFGQAGNLPLNVTDTATGNPLSFPCVTVK